MKQDMFPVGMFVLIKLPGSHEDRLRASPGIILPDNEKTDERTQLVALSSGGSRRFSTNALVPVSQLEPEDFSRDPQSLLDRRPKLKDAFWDVYGDLLRGLVLTD